MPLRKGILIVLLFLSACLPPKSSEPKIEQADIIFYNGTILTMESSTEVVQALAVQGEKIMALGTSEEILTLKGLDTKLINLENLTLMPGFVDAHTHLLNDASEYETDLDGVQQLALEHGITTMGNMYTDPDFLAELQSYASEDKLRMRTNLYLIHNTNCGEVIGNWWQTIAPTRTAGELLRIAGVKLFADGGTCNLPALSYETSAGSGFGDLYLNNEEIAKIVKQGQDLGHQVAIHAIGDRAIKAALEGIKDALNTQPNLLRHRIEHNTILNPDLLPLYGEINVVATIFASYPACTPFGEPSPAPYNQWEWAWPSLIAANPDLHIAWHGDDPYVQPLNPLLELYGFITRKQALDDGTVCESPEWIQDDTLTAQQALPMMTREAAYALFRDEEVGTLAVGKFADLIILSDSPLNENAETLLETKVLLTMVGGNTEYCEEASDKLCP